MPRPKDAVSLLSLGHNLRSHPSPDTGVRWLLALFWPASGRRMLKASFRISRSIGSGGSLTTGQAKAVSEHSVQKGYWPPNSKPPTASPTPAASSRLPVSSYRSALACRGCAASPSPSPSRQIAPAVLPKSPYASLQTTHPPPRSIILARAAYQIRRLPSNAAVDWIIRCYSTVHSS